MDLKVFDLNKEKKYEELVMEIQKCLISPHPLTNFEIQKYYQNKPKFNGIYPRDNLPKKIKDGAYVINFDKHADVSTHWISICKKY